MSTVKSKAPRQTRSGRAGLSFPVCKIESVIKKGGITRVSPEAAVWVTAVEEFICAEFLTRATVVAKKSKRYTNSKTGEFRVVPRHLDLAAARDTDLARIMGLSHLVPS